MKVVNIHSRIINQPEKDLTALFATLATKEDKIWPYEKWPAIRFKQGIKLGSSGGHGPIKYTISDLSSNKSIRFDFNNPKGFHGYHALKITPVTENTTELKHIIKMNTSGVDIFTWALVIRWLHDALIEDAFDKVENYFSKGKKETKWTIWVKLWRRLLTPRK